ncbi:hypothetical protein GCM10009682_24160 [Luedemannella flava]|uniref:Uncharacterized protein n=1 Tax=Luedemannella flava TaxID=349316 RepID=A0ABN2LWM8_9ACTN
MGVPRWLRWAQPWEMGVAVRRDWPDGSHDLFGWRRTGSDLGAAMRADLVYWLRAPARPVYCVVTVSMRDFLLHGRRDVCRASDCPTAPARSAGAVADGVVAR